MKRNVKYITYLIGVNCIGINVYCTHIIYFINNEIVSIEKLIHY